jgi:hypothetical protein
MKKFINKYLQNNQKHNILNKNSNKMVPIKNLLYRNLSTLLMYIKCYHIENTNNTKIQDLGIVNRIMFK